jgi:hypothetical protein
MLTNTSTLKTFSRGRRNPAIRTQLATSELIRIIEASDELST